MIDSRPIYFVGTELDRSYLSALKTCAGVAPVKYSDRLVEPTTVSEVIARCNQYDFKRVITTSEKLLALLVAKHGYTGRKKPSVNNYAGSLFTEGDIEILVVPPLRQLMTVKYGKFLVTRYITKFTKPDNWLDFPKFEWMQVTPQNYEDVLESLSSAWLIGCDHETIREPAMITYSSFTGAWWQDGKLRMYTYVLKNDSMFAMEVMRRINALPIQKVLQNGMYDAFYDLRHNCPMSHYFWDTAQMHHAWYSELPKDLGSLTAFYMRDVRYWKDMAETNNEYEYMEYNARDTYGTVCSAIAWFKEAPAFAKNNYRIKFPVVFPFLLSEVTGLKRDEARQVQIASEIEASMTARLERIRRILGKPGFNPSSPKQCLALMKILGERNAKSSEESELKKLMFKHPLNNLILGEILEYRGERKMLSTYIEPGKEFKGHIYYSLRGWATDTGRNASKESSLWCGLQIQNIPRGKSAAKQTLCAFDGFKIAENDLKQAESRDTAYLSGDEAMIAAVTGSRDFHSVNASAFFGIPYEAIYQDEAPEYICGSTGEVIPAKHAKTLNKVIRDLAKRTNHGANYCMGPAVMVDTMGYENVLRAKVELKLPASYSFTDVTSYLLERFHSAYPTLRKHLYPKVIREVETTKMLVGATGWTRYCFGKPRDNKLDLNAYVAHGSQSLNAMKLDKAYLRVFYEVALPNPDTFRLCAQIHDSILYMFKDGHHHLADKVRECMEVEVTVTAATGKKYTYTVPADIKAGPDGKGVKYWADVE